MSGKSVVAKAGDTPAINTGEQGSKREEFHPLKQPLATRGLLAKQIPPHFPFFP